MRQKVGFLLQLMVLMLTPLIIGYELMFPVHFLFVPTGLLVAISAFTLGHFLRQP